MSVHNPLILIRLLEERDLDALHRLDQLVSRVPWSRNMLRDELIFSESFVYGAFLQEELIGFLIGRILVDEVHILSVVVDPKARRRGIAAKLLDCALPDFAERDLKWATLEVRTSNGPAISLYEKFGFVEIGTRRNYYSDNGEDAFIYTVDLKHFGQQTLQVGNLD